MDLTSKSHFMGGAEKRHLYVHKTSPTTITKETQPGDREGKLDELSANRTVKLKQTWSLFDRNGKQ